MKISGVSYVSRHKRKYGRSKVSSYISILLILVFVIVLIVSAFLSWNLSHPPKLITQILDIKEFATMSDITFKDSKNSLNLSGLYFKAQNPDNCIVLSHSYGKNRMIFDSATSTFIKACLERNFNVLTFDYRNSGNSEGKSSSFGYYEKYDLLGAIKYAKANGAKHVSILGISTGASVALLAVAEDPGVIDAVIADSSFSDLKQHLYYNLPTWNKLPTFPFSVLTIPFFSLFTGIDVGDISPLKAMTKIPAEKVMLIQSEDDSVVPYKNSLKLFEQSDSASVFWVIKNAAHGKIFETYQKEYVDRVLSFIQKHTPTSLNTDVIQTPNISAEIPEAVIAIEATATPTPVALPKQNQKNLTHSSTSTPVPIFEEPTTKSPDVEISHTPDNEINPTNSLESGNSPNENIESDLAKENKATDESTTSEKQLP